MAAPLRAASNLKLAKTLLVSFVGLGALIVVGGAGTPVLLTLSKDVVKNVEGLSDSYQLEYGETLDLRHAKLTIGNAFTAQKEVLDGRVFTVRGFDAERIEDVQPVTLSYLDFTKEIKVTVAAKKLATVQPSFNFDTGILDWEPITGGQTYSVTLRDPTSKQSIATYSTQETEYNLNSVRFYTEFEVVVGASNPKKGTNGKSAYLDSDLSNPLNLRKVPDVTNVQYDDVGKQFTWDALTGVANYEVHINESTFSPTTNSIAYDTATPGEYTISVRGIASGGSSYATPTQVTFRRLPTPILSLGEDGKIAVENQERTVFYLDGVEFTGDLSSITEVGDYEITAKNVAQSQYEIPSAMSDKLRITKLAAPTISLVAAGTVGDYPTLNAEGVGANNSVQYYLNGAAWDGNFARITNVGDHTIRAKQIGLTNELDSELSNTLKVTKLSAPEVSFDQHDFTFSNKREGFMIYVDDQRQPALDGIDSAYIDTLSTGIHRVRARNLGNGTDLIVSNESNNISFLKPDINIAIGKNGSDRVAVMLTHTMEEVLDTFDASVKVTWKKDGQPDLSQDFDISVYKNDPTAVPRIFYFQRGETLFNRIEFDVTLDKPFETSSGSSVDIYKRQYATIGVDRI